MNLYFDYAAAAPADEDVLKRFARLAAMYPANQEAAGAAGAEMRKAVAGAEYILAKAFCGEGNANDCGILWTMTGTEAVGAAITAAGQICKGGDVLYTDGEHDSVLAALKRLPTGFRLVKVGVKRNGQIDCEDFKAKLSRETAFAALHWVQSETGCIQPLANVREILDAYAPKCLLIADTIQGAGKIPFDYAGIRPDMALISGQKIGVPAGGAMLYSLRYRKVFGELRSVHHAVGRIPPAFAVLLAEHFAKRVEEMPENERRMRELKQELLAALKREIPAKTWFATLTDGESSPYILHLQFSGEVMTYQGAILVRILNKYGASIASGSACNAETDQPSRILSAMGVPKDKAYSGVRLSLFDHVKTEQIQSIAELMGRAVREY